MAAAPNPVIVLIAPRRSQYLIDEFGRYQRDYDVCWAGSAAEASQLTDERAAAGAVIAMFVSEAQLPDGTLQDALARWRTAQPTARRVVLVDPDRLVEDRTALVSDLAANRFDAMLLTPLGRRDEEFHSAITEMLSDWSATVGGAQREWVQIIASGDEPLTVSIREFFDRSGYPHKRMTPTACPAGRRGRPSRTIGCRSCACPRLDAPWRLRP